MPLQMNSRGGVAPNEDFIQSLIDDINKRVSDKILEQSNADLLIKLIKNADSLDEAINIASLGTTYKKTGLHFDKRLEKMSDTINYFKKNEDLSFHTDESKPTNKLIIGDNYQALQNLLIQYKNKINVIYIDPPYGKDSMGEFAKTNYNNAITRDNLLSMLYPRLQLAKQLLSDDGVIFCSIDDKNQAYVKCLFDEVFGEENIISTLPTIMNLKGNQDEFGFAGTHEYTLVYCKNKQTFSLNEFSIDEESLETWEQDSIGYYKQGATLKRTGVDAPRKKRPFGYFPILIDIEHQCIKSILETEYFQIYNKETKTFNDNFIESLREKYENQGLYFLLPITKDAKTSWRWSFAKIKEDCDEIIIISDENDYSLYKKQRPDLGDLPSKKPKSIFYKPEYSSGNGTTQHTDIFGNKLFGNPKPIELIKDFIYLGAKQNSLILDFFAGSGTTGHAVLDLNKQDGGNRTFILCQLNEKTETTPNGIAYDVTSKRLKRVMTGECYDGTNDFPWIKDNYPYGGNLDVYEIESVANFESTEGKTPFEVIDETLYGKEKFSTVKEKIDWVCSNFEKTQKYLEDVEN